MFAGSQRSEAAAGRQPERNHGDQFLTFNDPLWPLQWELVGVIVCVFSVASPPSLLSTLVLSVKDVTVTGISQAGFHV